MKLNKLDQSRSNSENWEKYKKCELFENKTVTQQQLRSSSRPGKSHDFDSNLDVGY